MSYIQQSLYSLGNQAPKLSGIFIFSYISPQINKFLIRVIIFQTLMMGTTAFVTVEMATLVIKGNDVDVGPTLPTGNWRSSRKPF